MIGKSISHYRIVAKVGQGGMGVVWKGYDARLERTVAIKVLSDGFNQHLRERLLREAKLAAGLRHPNICPIYDVGTSEGQLFVAMPFLEGRPLDEWSADGALPMAVALDAVRQIASGLHEAHQNDIIHRDVKSSNILLTDKGEAILLDFGLARGKTDARLTTSGTLLGTAAYMSPEQVNASEFVDHRTDVWSLGVVLYEALAGELPFGGHDSLSAMYAIANKEPRPLRESVEWVPQQIDSAIRRALAKSPDDRFQSMAEMAAALETDALPEGAPKPKVRVFNSISSGAAPSSKQPTIATLVEEVSEMKHSRTKAYVFSGCAIVAFAVTMLYGDLIFPEEVQADEPVQTIEQPMQLPVPRPSIGGATEAPLLIEEATSKPGRTEPPSRSQSTKTARPEPRQAAPKPAPAVARVTSDSTPAPIELANPKHHSGDSRSSSDTGT